MKLVSNLITRELKTAAEAGDRDKIISKNRIICALFQYATFLEQEGQPEMVNAIMCAARASKSHRFMYPIHSYITTLFGDGSPPSLNRVIALASPHVDWEDTVYQKTMLIRWAAAALVVHTTEEVSQSVVDTLLQISSIPSLQLHIPTEIWAWMKKRPSLQPGCWGLFRGATPETVRYVRGLGDVEIIKSYFLIVWSEWDVLYYGGLDEMVISIRGEFDGIGMWGHRADLVKRLDHILRQLNLGSDYFKQHNPLLGDGLVRLAKQDYRKLEEVLMEVDREAINTLTRAPSMLTPFNKYTDCFGCIQDPTLPSLAHYPFRAHDFTFGAVRVTSSSSFSYFHAACALDL